LGKCAWKLRPRVLHDRPPRRSIGIAGIDQPRPIAGKNIENGIEYVAHHLFDVARCLHGAVDAVHALQELEVAPVFRLGALALGDVAADTAVAHEAPDLIERRDAGH
jgi:hypothetical protein